MKISQVYCSELLTPYTCIVCMPNFKIFHGWRGGGLLIHMLNTGKYLHKSTFHKLNINPSRINFFLNQIMQNMCKMLLLSQTNFCGPKSFDLSLLKGKV